jgi:HlyD family secretion protein
LYDLLTADVLQVHPEARASLRDWGGHDVIAARVRRVDPAAFTKVSALGLEEQRVRAVLDLVGPPPPGLGHDFRVTVSIDIWQGQNVITVPSTALFRTGASWAVLETTP